jgi:hypothetical protein
MFTSKFHLDLIIITEADTTDSVIED